MLESELWYNKTVTKNVKGTKTMEFIKTFDQYPYNILISSLILYSAPLPQQKGSIFKHACLGEITDFHLSGGL